MLARKKLQKAFATNLNSSAFGTKIPTITKPSGGGVFEWSVGSKGGLIPKMMKLVPYGLGANNDGFSLRIWGWAQIGENQETPQATLWVPFILGEFTCLLGNVTGIALAPVLNTEFFCDTITPVAARTYDYKIAAGTSVNSDYATCLVVNDTPSFIYMPTFGFEMLEFEEDQTTNAPTMGVLIQGWDDNEVPF